MTPFQLIEHFGGEIPQAAESLGLHRQTVWQWAKQGFIPFKSQRLIEFETGGALKANGKRKGKK